LHWILFLERILTFERVKIFKKENFLKIFTTKLSLKAQLAVQQI